MHERLKFKIHLSEQRGKDKEWGYQPICSEAQYGTHFVINARFEGTEDDNCAINLDNIHFYIQNYTGDVTIGLEKFSLIEECNPKELKYGELLEPNYFDGSKIYKITLFAQGLNNNFKHTHKIDGTLNKIKPGDILVTEVVYLPISKKLSFWDDKSKYNEASYLDPLYQLRDGEHVKLTDAGIHMIKKLNLLGIIEKDSGKFDFGSIDSFDIPVAAGPSRNCKADVSMAI